MGLKRNSSKGTGLGNSTRSEKTAESSFNTCNFSWPEFPVTSSSSEGDGGEPAVNTDRVSLANLFVAVSVAEPKTKAFHLNSNKSACTFSLL